MLYEMHFKRASDEKKPVYRILERLYCYCSLSVFVPGTLYRGGTSQVKAPYNIQMINPPDG